MNWGNKIAIVIALFVIAMMSMVFVAFKQTNEMIDDNYYDNELKYQSRIDASSALNNVSSTDLITTRQGQVIIQLPKSLCTSFTDGKLDLLRGNDKSKDLHIDIIPDSNGLFVFNDKKLINGKYNARIFWKNNNNEYYKEQTVFIEK